MLLECDWYNSVNDICRMFFSLQHNSPVSRELTRLMKIPLDHYNDILTVLKLEHYGPLFEYFDYRARKTMSSFIITNALENDVHMPTQDQVGIYL